MDIKFVSKVVFLGFVVTLAVYIVTAGIDPKSSVREMFENVPKNVNAETKNIITTPVVKQPLRQQITNVYVDLFLLVHQLLRKH
jgi:MFS superfamily sulfate permease-like transporter